MTVFAKHLVLRLHYPLKGSHEYAAFAGEVTEYLLLKCGGKEISRANGNTQCNNPFFSPSCMVLED